MSFLGIFYNIRVYKIVAYKGTKFSVILFSPSCF